MICCIGKNSLICSNVYDISILLIVEIFFKRLLLLLLLYYYTHILQMTLNMRLDKPIQVLATIYKKSYYDTCTLSILLREHTKADLLYTRAPPTHPSPPRNGLQKIRPLQFPKQAQNICIVPIELKVVW